MYVRTSNLMRSCLNASCKGGGFLGNTNLRKDCLPRVNLFESVSQIFSSNWPIRRLFHCLRFTPEHNLSKSFVYKWKRKN